MLPKILRIATRKSPLALWQAHHIRDQLLTHWPTLSIELVPKITSGDTFQRTSTESGKGLFVKELEEALLSNEADIAVHSMKDVPAAFPEGLCLAAIGPRHSPFDALVSPQYASLDQLPKHARIGTTSLRRQSQLLTARPDLHLLPLHGNIQSRLTKLHAGAFEALVLAVAGLERLELHHEISEIFHVDLMLPACGQGALGIECRQDDLLIKQLIAPLNDTLSTLCVQTERQVSAQLGGHCHAPLAVYCTMTHELELLLRAKVGSPDGSLTLSNVQRGNAHEASLLALRCAEALLANGARALLDNTSL